MFGLLEPQNLIYAFLLASLQVLVAGWASVHAVLTKRDVRAAIGWVVAIWVAPVLGSLFYWIFGINRIHRKAAALLGERREEPVVPAMLAMQQLEPCFGPFGMVRFIDGLVRRPLLPGNQVDPLVGGREAYAAMLDAIGSAQKSVSLLTYIFDDDPAGREFADALTAARARGVEVRVLVDAVGGRYSRRPMVHVLREAGVRSAPFMPTWHPLRAPYMNLRNHRKILVVDGETGFTGGMNIREGHRGPPPDAPGPQPSSAPAGSLDAIEDVHFRLRGPVVSHLQEIFSEDWVFATSERLEGERWFPQLDYMGPMDARGIPDGPDRDLGKIQWAIKAALACAKHRVKVVTPYFLPIDGLDSALQTAARRGVHVDIFLPQQSNLLLVGWASRGLWEQVLEGGCRIWLTPKPFDHAKLMIVDSDWSFIGSSNWDARSLRLNFELNVEVHSSELNRRLDELIETKRSRSRPVILDEHRKRPVGTRLLDGWARLLAPYL